MTKIKICGLKTLADVETVNKYLPEYAGFVFANTKRFVTDDQAFKMKQALDGRIQSVGVFVNEPLAHIISLCEKGIIDAVQLHGEEPESYIRELRNRLKGKNDIIVIKATRVQNARQVSEHMSEEADFMLYDTYKKGEHGGTGERFPLEILEESLSDMKAAGRSIKPYFLAGGLDSQNVTGVIGQSGCYAVDVSTGVETDGVKDGEKIRQFIEAVRSILNTERNEYRNE